MCLLRALELASPALGRLFTTYPISFYSYHWWLSLMKCHLINDTFPDYMLTFSVHPLHSSFTVCIHFLYFSPEHFHHQVNLMFIFYLFTIVYLPLFGTLVCKLHEGNFFWTKYLQRKYYILAHSITIFEWTLSILFDQCWLYNHMWRTTVTLPTCSALNTNLCLSFSLLELFAPYSSYGPLLHALHQQ